MKFHFSRRGLLLWREEDATVALFRFLLLLLLLSHQGACQSVTIQQMQFLWIDQHYYSGRSCSPRYNIFWISVSLVMHFVNCENSVLLEYFTCIVRQLHDRNPSKSWYENKHLIFFTGENCMNSHKGFRRWLLQTSYKWCCNHAVGRMQSRDLSDTLRRINPRAKQHLHLQDLNHCSKITVWPSQFQDWLYSGGEKNRL